ncbi:MAG: BlaI/MecI/CopY family transcriptional regulator [Oligoflexia bacterium]|nr:BlaI/MecI/CopY family transcriptional regulator [Oligoflexia bacterium]
MVKKIKSITQDEKTLTEVELELMSIIWKLKEASVADVQVALPENRPLAYTSISTILRILEQKEILKTRKVGRGHIYIPVLQKSEYESRALKHVIENVFDGTPVALVKQLLGSVQIKKNELEELKKLIANAGENQ